MQTLVHSAGELTTRRCQDLLTRERAKGTTTLDTEKWLESDKLSSSFSGE
jgi:hypothetical protein